MGGILPFEAKLYVVDKNCQSHKISVTSGVPTIFIDDIGSCFENSRYLLYANDLKIYRGVASVVDALHEDIDRLFDYSNRMEASVIFLFLDVEIPTTPLNTALVEFYRGKLMWCDRKITFEQHINYVVQIKISEIYFSRNS